MVALAGRRSVWAAALAGHRPLGAAACAVGAGVLPVVAGDRERGARDELRAGTEVLPGAGWNCAGGKVGAGCKETDRPGFGISATASSRPFSTAEKSRVGESFASEEVRGSGGTKSQSVLGGAAGGTGAANTVLSGEVVGTGLPVTVSVPRAGREMFRTAGRRAAGAVSAASRTKGELGAETFTRETDADQKPKGRYPPFQLVSRGWHAAKKCRAPGIDRILAPRSSMLIGPLA